MRHSEAPGPDDLPAALPHHCQHSTAQEEVACAAGARRRGRKAEAETEAEAAAAGEGGREGGRGEEEGGGEGEGEEEEEGDEEGRRELACGAPVTGCSTCASLVRACSTPSRSSGGGGSSSSSSVSTGSTAPTSGTRTHTAASVCLPHSPAAATSDTRNES